MLADQSSQTSCKTMLHQKYIVTSKCYIKNTDFVSEILFDIYLTVFKFSLRFTFQENTQILDDMSCHVMSSCRERGK